MFETVSQRLGTIFSSLTKRGLLSEQDVAQAMAEIRRALIEADVALEVVKSFIKKVQEKAVGSAVIKSVSPGQMVIKIVSDELKKMLGSEVEPINLNATPPIAMMLVGLQGSGKTTSTAKLAKYLSEKQNKKVLMASLDINRPAAQEQLQQLGEQIKIETLPIVKGQDVLQISQRASMAAKLGGYDILLLDTAGRTHIDETLMFELQQIEKTTNPVETLLVADSLTGQDAVNLARNFNERVNLTGIVLTRIDGDGRGGAALSMRAVTGKPIKMMGVGEKLADLEPFHPQRIAERILGMGDIVSLVEKASENFDSEQAKAAEQKLKKGLFDLNDMAAQLKQLTNMGGVGSLMGLLPGMGKLKSQMANVDENMFSKQLVIIDSMTKGERRSPKLLNGSRKKRIAAGSGRSVQEINQLLKMHRQMADMMKGMGGKKGRGMMQQMAQAFGMGGMAGRGGMPPVPNMPNMANIQNLMQGAGGSKLPGLGAPLEAEKNG